MELLEYWHLFRKWLWLILLAAMVAAGGGLRLQHLPDADLPGLYSSGSEPR